MTTSADPPNLRHTSDDVASQRARDFARQWRVPSYPGRHTLSIKLRRGLVAGPRHGLHLSTRKFCSDNRSHLNIFFVISGFVMVYTQSNNARSAFSFFRNRILRIVPTYWLLSVAVVVLFVLIPSTFRGLKLTGAYSLTSLFFVSRIFGYDYPIIYVGWTLEYEMPFYALFAAGFSSRTNELPLLFQ